MYKILKNALICVIPLLLFVLCSCGKPAEDNTVSDITADERQKISDEYYKSHDQVSGYELYILNDKKSCVQIPENSKVFEMSVDNLQITPEDNLFSLEISRTASSGQICESAEDVMNAYEENGLHLTGEVTEFKKINDGEKEIGYSFIQKVNDDTPHGWLHAAYYDEDDVYSLTAHMSDLSDAAISAAENCVNSFALVPSP